MYLFQSSRNQNALYTLLAAVQEGTLGHSSKGGCAVTHLLGGASDWLDAINPLRGTIDHHNKLSSPRRFAYGLKMIENASFSVDEIIRLEAQFEGRVADENGNFLSTLDDDNDPGGLIGLNAVIHMLQLFDQKTAIVRQPQVLASLAS